MVDLAPEGCLSLRDFYDEFTSWKWNTDDLIGELSLERRVAILPEERKALARAALSAVMGREPKGSRSPLRIGPVAGLHRPSWTSERRVISARSWAKAFFAERFFLSADVQGGHGSELKLRGDEPSSFRGSRQKAT
jgi:hypothetical protein